MKKIPFTLVCSFCMAQFLSAQEALPFVESFDEASSMERFTVVDANNDGKTWTYDANAKLVRYDYHSYNAGDDWLFTPAFNLEAGKEYKVSFTTQGKYMSTYEKVSVTVGKDLQPSSHTDLGTVVVMWNSEFRLSEFLFTVPETATYHVGFHEISDPDTYYLFLDDIRIEEISNEVAPATVSDASITPGEQGGLYADISFVAPSLNVDGGELSSLDAVEVYRNEVGNPIKTFENPVMGETCQFRDEVETSGEYTYTIVARNKGGESEKVEVSSYIGYDEPLAVNGLDVKVVDGCPSLSWQAPQAGVHQGYVDVEALTYTVMRDDTVCVQSGLSQQNFVDESITFTTTQQVLARYTVWAVNGEVAGEQDTTSYVVVGEPYMAPMTESFMMTETDTYPWYSENIGTNNEKYWIVMTYGYSPQTYAWDDDAGLITFRSAVAPEGTTERFHSPIFNISEMVHPALSFYMFHTVDAINQDALQIEVSANGADWQSVGEKFILGTAATENEWQQHVVSLASFEGCDSLAFALKGISAQGRNIHVDCISLFDDCYDLRPASVVADGWVDPDKTFIVTVTVENSGAKEIDSYSVELLRNGETVQTQDAAASLAAGETAQFMFDCFETLDAADSDIAYSARVVCSKDEKADNNLSDEIIVNVVKPVLPIVSGLGASTEGLNVHLSWMPADNYENYPVITDDIESYEAFIISNVGNWTMVDADGEMTGMSSNTSLYPNIAAPMAFQVFNPVEADIDMETYELTWSPYSGNQYLLGMYNENPEVPNDDWLISPMVESASEVSFYAKSVTIGYALAKVEFLYSTTTADPESFQVMDAMTIPATWSRYTYRLPQDAKYFAIHHTTLGGLGLMIDDITYKPITGTPEIEEPMGYNVYRDGVKITSAPVEQPQYDDVVPVEAEYQYQVTAVYPAGESYYSEPLVVRTSSSLSSVTTSDGTVYGSDGVIKVNLPQSGMLRIYATDGTTLVNRWQAAGIDTISMPRGLYIVRFDNQVWKVVVR